MNTTLMAICNISGTDQVITPRRANARLAPGGREGPRERDSRVARTPLADEAARWQLILDLLDPDNRCGAWSPATFQGRPVVCTRVPHDAREKHANAETGRRWYRTALGRHLRELQVILASAPGHAAAVVACTVPASTSGPPLHVHAASDEIFFILSGELLVHADGHVATIREGGLVHISCAMPHTYRDDTRHSGALPGAVHHARPDRDARGAGTGTPAPAASLTRLALSEGLV